MKKLIAKLIGGVTALAMAIGVGVAVANNRFERMDAVEVEAYTLSGTVTSTGNAYNGENDVTQSTIAWKVNGNTSTNPWRIGGHKNNGLSSAGTIRHIQSQAAVSSHDITKVVVTTAKPASNYINPTNVSLKVGTSAGASDTNSLSNGSWESSVTFDRPNGKDWSSKYFEIDFTMPANNTTTTKFITLTSIVFYYESANVQTYTLTYDSNGGSGEIIDASSPYASGATVTVKNSTGFDAPAGKEFSHWYTTANGSGGTRYDPGDTFAISANTTLFAQWENLPTYTVTYDSNEGSGSTTDANSPYLKGADVTIANNEFTRSGYTFSHWDTQANDNGTDYDGGDTLSSIAADTTLYAQWNENLGDLVGETGTINFGTSATRIDAVKKYGKDNLGVSWRAVIEGTTNFTQNASYSQIGASSSPATSFSFNSSSFGATYKITSFSAKFGGFSNTAGAIALKVGDTTVGTGSLSGSSDVTVSNTAVATGSSLSIEVSNIDKGVKVYFISYTLAPELDTQIITASDESAYSDETIILETNADSATWSFTANTAGASLSDAEGKDTEVSATQPGSVTVQAVAAGYTTVTKSLTFIERPAGTFYDVTFNSNGGSNSPSGLEVLEGATFTFPSPGTKAHYSFDGWTSTGSAPYYAVDATSPAITGDITYTAHWTEDAKYVVEYVSDGNGTGSYLEEEYGGSYELLSYASISGDVTPNSGYRFKDYTVGGVHKNPGDEIILSDDVEVTVNFEEIPQAYEIFFGSTKDTNPDGITTDEGFKNTYDFNNKGDITISGLAKIYGESSTMLKLGSSKATASITFAIPLSYYITSVVVEIDTAGGTSMNVTSGADDAETENQAIAAGTLTFDNYLASERSNSVTLASTANGAFYVTSIIINYETFRHDVESLTTQTMLSYRYEDNGSGGFNFSDISIRFGGLLSKTLWDELDTSEHLISGFGVMITTFNVVHEYENIKDYAAMAVSADTHPNLNSNIANYYMPKVGEPSMSTPPESGDNYAWNLFFRVDWEDRDETYIAAAYIKVGDEYVFFGQKYYSVISLSLDYLANRGCNNSTADGSLKYLSEQTMMS